MGAYTANWSTGSDSFTVLANGSKRDYGKGGDYNRGRIFWNNGGPITVEICTAWDDLEAIDICTEQEQFTVANR